MFPRSAEGCEWPSWPHTAPLYPQLECAAQEEQWVEWGAGGKAGCWTFESRELGGHATFNIGTAPQRTLKPRCDPALSS